MGTNIHQDLRRRPAEAMPPAFNTSLQGGLDLTLMEAMTSGTPVHVFSKRGVVDRGFVVSGGRRRQEASTGMQGLCSSKERGTSICVFVVYYGFLKLRYLDV
ncbi:hypothetical protein RJ639_021636 [Escallonia herrerae]|uniref:Uncharacterized protein n=1 Tax=Escallonia herrerae TaxID=1293975 RepID=A0AA88V530_9ASTE|nr:hypothetical protein RJ639_021636 [Escallonia herrerae]